MAENLSINAGSKEEKYRELLPQLYALISTETDFIANLANLSAALKQTFNFFWVGFYLVKGDELVLGPFPFWQRSLRHGLERSTYADCS